MREPFRLAILGVGAIIAIFLFSSCRPKPESLTTSAVDGSNPESYWFSQAPRGERKGFSLCGIQPNDDIHQLENAVRAPFRMVYLDRKTGRAEVHHPVRKVILEIWYRPETGKIQAVSADGDVPFENNGERVSIANRSLKSFESVVLRWSSKKTPNIAFDGRNTLTAYPIEPGNQIGFLVLSLPEGT